MKKISKKELWKHQLITFAKWHKANCNDPLCNIGLFHFLEMGQELGIIFTPEEEHIFL